MKTSEQRKCKLSASYSWKQKPESHMRHIDSTTVEIEVNEEEYHELQNNLDARVRRFKAAVSPKEVVSINEVVLVN